MTTDCPATPPDGAVVTPWSGRTTMGRRLRPEHPRRKGGRAPCAEAGGPNASGAPLPPRPSRPGTVGADGATARGPGLRGSASRARPQRRRRSPNRSSRLTGRASGCRSWRCPCWRRHRRPPPLGVHHRSLVLEQPPRPRAAHYTSAARPAHHLLVDVGPVDEDAHVDPRRAATTNSSTSLTGGKLAVVNQSRVRAPNDSGEEHRFGRRPEWAGSDEARRVVEEGFARASER